MSMTWANERCAHPGERDGLSGPRRRRLGPDLLGGGYPVKGTVACAVWDRLLLLASVTVTVYVPAAA